MQVYIKQITNQSDLDDALNLRKNVFCTLQNIPFDIEIDKYDSIDTRDVLHFGLYDNNLISYIRIIIEKDKIKIGRVVTDPLYQYNGYMTKLFSYLINYTYNFFPKKYLYLESQVKSIKMYRKFGFIEYEEVFNNNGILHQKMKRRPLSPYLYSSSNKRYYQANHYWKHTYNYKVGRVMLDAGFTCPNIDGSKGRGGCTFCSIHGSGDYAGSKHDDLLLQWDKGLDKLQKKWGNIGALAYFQAFTNTYSSIAILKEKYETFIDLDCCTGVIIATRPDCINDDIMRYFNHLNNKIDVYLEFGLQTIREDVAEDFNRGYCLKEFEQAMALCKKYEIKPIIHVINGLPGETKKDMLNTIHYLNKFDIGGIKIHLLHILYRTKMYKQFIRNEFELLTMEDYADIVVCQIKILRENIVVHRLTGDAPIEDFIGPLWSRKKTIVQNTIDKLLVSQNSFQGIDYED